MNKKNTAAKNLLEWIIEMDFKFYKTGPTLGAQKYIYYLLGSQERFRVKEVIKIFNLTAKKELQDRWKNAIIDNITYLRNDKNN